MPLPTAATFKARHARFAAVADATVDAYIADAGLTVVEECWIATDYPAGVMYLAAHLMEVEGARNPTGKSIGTAGAVKKQKAGEVEIEYAVAPIGASDDIEADYRTTSFGRQFIILANRNSGLAVPGALVV